MEWSYSGDRLALERQTSAQSEILGWNVVRQQLRTFWKFDPQTTQIERLMWLSDSDALVVQSLSRGASPTRVVALFRTDGSRSVLYQGDAKAIIALRASPLKPLGSIFLAAEQGMQWTVFNANGAMGAVAEVKLPSDTATVATIFGPDGDGPFVQTMTRAGDSLRGGKTFGYDPSGRIVEVPHVPDGQIESLLRPDHLNAITEPLPAFGAERRGRAKVFLRQGQKKVLVTTDGTVPKISPNEASLVYLHLGGAIIRPIVRMPLAEYQKQARKEAQRQAMEDASRIADALSRNASFGNGIPNSGNWREFLRPILEDDGVLDTFTYVYAGGPKVPPAQAASTELGYFVAFGGRAAITADFKVKWIPNEGS